MVKVKLNSTLCTIRRNRRLGKTGVSKIFCLRARTVSCGLVFGASRELNKTWYRLNNSYRTYIIYNYGPRTAYYKLMGRLRSAGRTLDIHELKSV